MGGVFLNPGLVMGRMTAGMEQMRRTVLQVRKMLLNHKIMPMMKLQVIVYLAQWMSSCAGQGCVSPWPGSVMGRRTALRQRVWMSGPCSVVREALGRSSVVMLLFQMDKHVEMTSSAARMTGPAYPLTGSATGGLTAGAGRMRRLAVR